jgi:ParB family chromosome partitioning protein
LIEKFGRTQDAVAKVVGKSRSHVANALRLLSLPESVKAHMLAGRLSAGHARALATAPDLESLAQQVADKGLSVREAEALARRSHERASAPEIRQPAPSSRVGGGKDADTRALEQDLGQSLGLKVEIDHKGSKGEVRVAYRSLEQLDEICRRLSRL